MQSHRLVTLVVLAGVAFTGRAVADDGDGTALRSAIDTVTSTDAEMVVTATRTRRDVFDLPQSIVTVSQDEIANTGGLVAMKALYRKDAGIWYDERTSTTTDPIIRGFAGFNLLIGWANDYTGASAANPGGYALGMWLFSVLGFVGLLFAVLLRRRETGPHGHGLETITAGSTP